MDVDFYPYLSLKLLSTLFRQICISIRNLLVWKMWDISNENHVSVNNFIALSKCRIKFMQYFCYCWYIWNHSTNKMKLVTLNIIGALMILWSFILWKPIIVYEMDINKPFVQVPGHICFKYRICSSLTHLHLGLPAPWNSTCNLYIYVVQPSKYFPCGENNLYLISVTARVLWSCLYSHV